MPAKGKQYPCVKCAVCGIVVQKNNVVRHQRRKHPIELATWGGPFYTATGERPTRRGRVMQPKAVAPKAKPELPTGTDIVLSVTHLLFNGSVPTAKLDSVLRWAEHTNQFIREVTS